MTRCHSAAEKGNKRIALVLWLALNGAFEGLSDMFGVDHSRVNATAEHQLLDVLEIALMAFPIVLCCCAFVAVNGTMLFTLRSKPVFRETSRYVFLFNLLFADTAHLAMSQTLYLLTACRLTLTYPACGVLVMLTSLLNQISPLTLAAMSVERYVAVCYPLRHAAISAGGSTGAAVGAVWAFGCFGVLLRVLLLLQFPFEELESLQMATLCNSPVLFQMQATVDFEKAYTCVLFVSAGATVVSSYIGVMMAARSASTDRASALKARNTLLLHLVQLALSLSSTVLNPVTVMVAKMVSRTTFVRVQTFLYVLLSLFPRCLSSFIYGFRDRTFRSVFLYHLC